MHSKCLFSASRYPTSSFLRTTVERFRVRRPAIGQGYALSAIAAYEKAARMQARAGITTRKANFEFRAVLWGQQEIVEGKPHDAKNIQN
jgi:hypothetical protein